MTFVLWGSVLTWSLVLYTEPIGPFREMFYSKIPLIGAYWRKKLDTCDD